MQNHKNRRISSGERAAGEGGGQETKYARFPSNRYKIYGSGGLSDQKRRERFTARRRGSAQKKSPALAVGTRLKPARNGRWVASAVLLCFQLPTGGREACNSHSESASRKRNVGLKGSIRLTNRAGLLLNIQFCGGAGVIPPPRPPRRALP